jgi:hypothetical protein
VANEVSQEKSLENTGDKSARAATITEKAPDKTPAKADQKPANSAKPDAKQDEKSLENVVDKSSRAAPITETAHAGRMRKGFVLIQGGKIIQLSAHESIDLEQVIKDVKDQLVRTPPAPYFVLPVGVEAEVV